MEKRNLYIYKKTGNYKDIIAFLKMYDKVNYQYEQAPFLKVEVDINFSLSDFQELREFILEELLVDFIGFYLPVNQSLKDLDLTLLVKTLNYGIYDISDIITEICLSKNLDIQKNLKDYYYSLVGVENINTILGFIENNFNASLTAKKLFLHRNTLNYRLDNFIQKTEIDIKTFKKGLSIYLLFRR